MTSTTSLPFRLALAAGLAWAAGGCGDARRLAGASIPECLRCHGAPPATGAHLVHANPASISTLTYGTLHVLEDVSPAGGPSYDFGCGLCHPIDASQHWAHVTPSVAGARVPDVMLDPAGAPTTSLKARNAPGAAYDPTTGRCSGVYCHSSGQDPAALTSVAYRTTPPWDGPSGSLGCDGCHGNPPSYPSGGSGAPDANSHVNLDLEQFLTTTWEPTWEFGHFAGLPGPNHTSEHGGGDPATWGTTTRASPITCQACHFETVDPANVTGGGFFYFDASGDYDLRPAGFADRGTSSSWQAAQCVTCHAGDLGAGRVLPLRHVNGKRDVVFDRRSELPPGYATFLPAFVTTDAARPYYMQMSQTFAPPQLDPGTCATTHVPACDVARDVVVRDTMGGGRVLTFSLEHARYDPATKTCSSIACHLERQRQVDRGTGPASAPLRWGTPYLYGTSESCAGCHER